MKKFNYRTTVNINDTTMKLGLRVSLPSERQNVKIRVQAIFMQRQVERRFPMEVSIVPGDIGMEAWADAEIELPYIFLKSPKRQVNVIFAIWFGMEEVVLSDQPFPIKKELFYRADQKVKRNVGKFMLGTAGLPVLIAKNMIKEKNKTKAMKSANAEVYRFSGYSYSKRQRHTDYFAVQYQQAVKQTKVEANQVLFLSERLPEKGGNLQRIKDLMEKDSSLRISEFIVTKTIDLLSKKEIRECAKLCAKAHVIILEDFYPQLHSLSLRPETKVVQLWHACGAFKTFGLTRMGKQGGAPQSSMNHRNYNLAPVSSEAIRGIYAEAFGISKAKVQALGVPRTDVLYDEDYKKKKIAELYEKYPSLEGKKVVLFAPTFRGDGNKDAYYPADAFDVNQFMEYLPEDTFLIVKHHPFVHQSVNVMSTYENRVMDLTGKDHINDLLLITELLITDYSSSVFEAAILDVPMLFYAFDKEEYIESRDFYCDYDNFAPGYVEYDFENMCEKTQELLLAEGAKKIPEPIIHLKKIQFKKDFLSAIDGHSTERIATYIKEKMLQNI
ncbi:MAG: CDP-glycerol glycerophosphotransferase family protein [Eubacteriales bacterium]|nr:CDP-glycerol glycerophosphotransferase family protein [Eubacteriales bacterium]